MIKLKRSMVVAGFMTCAGCAIAADVKVDGPWVRGTVAGQKATGAFMAITASDGAALVSASSPLAGVVELHTMSMDDGVMRMRPVPKIDLPAGKAVELKPGGYHVMLMALKAPLKEGDAVPVTLTFKDKDGRESAVVVNAPVKALTAPPAPAHAKH